jgi:glycosyltransferase involved in cell wall biosynthesis
MLSTYPFKQPRHGGQVRTAAIAKAYTDDGYTVSSISVFETESYGPDAYDRSDVEFPPSSPYRRFRGRNVPLVTDLLTGHYATAEDGGLSLIMGKLPKQIDVIHVEQPWLWPLARKIKTIRPYSKACLVYGSQNIEAPLKKEILDSYGIKDADDVIEEINLLERSAAAEADIAVAVTKADFDVLATWGCKVLVLAANGISPWHASAEKLDYWSARLPQAPWILYVASAHPPNFQGFNESLGGSLACIPPDSRLVVAGSVGEHLARVLSNTRWGSLNCSRLELLYILPDEDLSAVKTLAHAFLLPIPHGGGSNIKTAEAIYSGKYVIGSDPAFRGFEGYAEEEGITVARTPDEFHQAIRHVLTQPELPRLSAVSADHRESVTWQKTLSIIPQSVNQAISVGVGV